MHEVEAYIEQFEGDQYEVLHYLHKLLTSYPSLSPKIRYKIPFYYQNKWVCYLNPIKNEAISLCFLRGYELSNEHGILESKGRKQVLSIDFKSIDEIPKALLHDTIKEALYLDEVIPYNPKGKSI